MPAAGSEPCSASTGEVLRQMARDPDCDHSLVAKNPCAPADVLLLLADDPDPEVRWGVAMNPLRVLASFSSTSAGAFG